jgi:hypothetical protein
MDAANAADCANALLIDDSRPRRKAAMTSLLLSAVLITCGAVAAAPTADNYFAIEVVDEATGRGVPLVELRTVDNTSYVTDSAGMVAFYEPGRMDQKVFFSVASPGYEFPADGFGFRGVALDVKRGGRAQLKIKRRNVAERLYRITGAGIYRDSVLVGGKPPVAHPLLNAQVTGSDSVQMAQYRGRLFWIWGDTNRPRYPLGNFHVPGATSRLPADGGLDPAVGIDLEYFVNDEGFARPTCQMPGDGPTWLDAMYSLRGEGDRETLYGSYYKVAAGMRVYQHGLVRFDDERKEFVKVAEFPLDALFHPHGHAMLHKVDGREHIYFGNPHPLVRVLARPESIEKLSEYEAFTPLAPGSRLKANGKVGVDVSRATVEREILNGQPAGAPRWGWKKDAPPVLPAEQQRLIAAVKLRAGEGLHALRDIETDKSIEAHGGNVAWNEFRKAWTMIVCESGGDASNLGEIWYAEAPSPLGPWVYARRVVTHDKTSFYNPRQHPPLAQEGGRLIYFEGTHTIMFSGLTVPMPRYEYNQIMYRLDLSDPRLSLPAPVFRQTADGAERLEMGAKSARTNEGIPFFAMSDKVSDLVPVYRRLDEEGNTVLSRDPPAEATAKSQPFFYALPADMEKPPTSAVPLYAWVSSDNKRLVYSTEKRLSGNMTRAEKPVCLVWRSPLVDVAIPWE